MYLIKVGPYLLPRGVHALGIKQSPLGPFTSGVSPPPTCLRLGLTVAVLVGLGLTLVESWFGMTLSGSGQSDQQMII